jgi:hypothetical protein
MVSPATLTLVCSISCLASPGAERQVLFHVSPLAEWLWRLRPACICQQVSVEYEPPSPVKTSSPARCWIVTAPPGSPPPLGRGPHASPQLPITQRTVIGSACHAPASGVASSAPPGDAPPAAPATWAPPAWALATRAERNDGPSASPSASPKASAGRCAGQRQIRRLMARSETFSQCRGSTECREAHLAGFAEPPRRVGEGAANPARIEGMMYLAESRRAQRHHRRTSGAVWARILAERPLGTAALVVPADRHPASVPPIV